MVGIAILQLISDTFKIRLVKLRDFDFVELNLSFIVLDDFFNFVFEFIVVLFYEL